MTPVLLCTPPRFIYVDIYAHYERSHKAALILYPGRGVSALESLQLRDKAQPAIMSTPTVLFATLIQELVSTGKLLAG